METYIAKKTNFKGRWEDVNRLRINIYRDGLDKVLKFLP